MGKESSREGNHWNRWAGPEVLEGRSPTQRNKAWFPTFGQKRKLLTSPGAPMAGRKPALIALITSAALNLQYRRFSWTCQRLR